MEGESLNSPPHNQTKQSLFALLWLVPHFKTRLELYGGLFGGEVAIENFSRDCPEFSFEIRFTTRENLVRVANGRFAFLTPAQEFLRQGVFQGDLAAGEREEARERIGVECGEFRRGHPGQEGLGVFTACAFESGVHAHANVGVIADAVHQWPKFPGGNEAFTKYLEELGRDMVAYLPKGMNKAYIQVEFVVDKDGVPLNFKVLKGIKDDDDFFNDELIKRMENMGTWEPALLHDKPVAKKMVQTFTIEAK